MVFMTEQQKDLERLTAWDRYQDSRKTILALKSKLEGWRKPLQTLAEKIARDQVHETDHFGIPTREEFTETVRPKRRLNTSAPFKVREISAFQWRRSLAIRWGLGLKTFLTACKVLRCVHRAHRISWLLPQT